MYSLQIEDHELYYACFDVLYHFVCFSVALDKLLYIHYKLRIIRNCILRVLMFSIISCISVAKDGGNNACEDKSEKAR